MCVICCKRVVLISESVGWRLLAPVTSGWASLLFDSPLFFWTIANAYHGHKPQTRSRQSVLSAFNKKNTKKSVSNHYGTESVLANETFEGNQNQRVCPLAEGMGIYEKRICRGDCLSVHVSFCETHLWWFAPSNIPSMFSFVTGR